MRIPLAVCAVMVAGCAMWISVDYEPLVRESDTARPVVEGAVSLFPGSPDRPHREVGILKAQGRAPVDMLKYRLRKKAREVRAEAVIRVRVSERRRDDLPPWLRWTQFGLEPPRLLVGTAVVFTGPPQVGHSGRGPEGEGGS